MFLLRGTLFCWLLICTSQLQAQQSLSEDELWKAINTPGHIVMMRHSIAPGTGDPSNFDLSDCSTQRNLSESGRTQAKEIGEQFRLNGIFSAQLYASPWCRCMETGELLGLGQVEALDQISSVYMNYSRQQTEQRTEDLTQWLREQPLTSPIVLITHGVNVSALTGVGVAQGDMVVVNVNQDSDFEVLGTLRAP